MRHTLKCFLLLFMLAACGQDPSPESFMQPEILDVSATVQEDGRVSFSCTMNDARSLTDCGFIFSADGVEGMRLKAAVVDGRHFRALSPALTGAGKYKYSAFASNGRVELQRFGGHFDITPDSGQGQDTSDNPDNPDDSDNPDSPDDPDTPETPPTPPDGMRSMLVEVEAGSNGWVYLPLRGGIDVTIDWGDGKIESFKGWYSDDDWISHKYVSSGKHVVCIEGSVEAVSTHNMYQMPYCEKILAVKRWGDLGVTSYSCALKNCENLSEVAADTLGVFRNTQVNNMFTGCKSLKAVPDSLFAWCAGDNMSGVFLGCSSLESIPAHIFAKCRSVISFDATFMECTSLTAVPEGLFDDCVIADTFQSVFSNCNGLKSVPVTLFDNNRRILWLRDAFLGCNLVTSESPYTMIGNEKVHLYERRDYRSDFSAPVEFDRCFARVFGGLPEPSWADYSNIPQSWK